MQWQTQILSEFENVIHEILGVISDDYTKGTKQSACVVCLHGELGAGKTTAVQIIARNLGVTETVNSPTFVIKKTYRTTTEPFKKLVHIDAYRLKLEDNLTLFEFEKDFSEPGTLVLIEWPEMIQSMIPENAFHMYIDHDKEGRVIRFENKKTA